MERTLRKTEGYPIMKNAGEKKFCPPKKCSIFAADNFVKVNKKCTFAKSNRIIEHNR